MLSRLRVIRSRSLVRLLVLITVPSQILLAQSDEPPFEWERTFASPGTALSIGVLQTMSGPPNGTVAIAVTSAGFAESPERVVMWQKSGGRYFRHKPQIQPDGTVQLVPGTDATLLGNYIRGQAFDVALHDEASGNRAHASLTPFPIAADGSGDCRGDAEVQVSSGLLWVVQLSGFDAGESVRLTSSIKKEVITDEASASDDGVVVFPILYPPLAKGTAQVSAAGANGCSVNLTFAIGKAALKAR